MPTAKSVLVTGGAGYIGSHVALALLAEGNTVVVLDNLSTGSKKLVPKGAIFIEGDIADKGLVASIIQDYNINDVVHFAAFVDVAESMREPSKYYKNNTWATGELILAAQKQNVDRFIFSSTAAVYGNPTETPTPEDVYLDPQSHYGLSKLFAEQMVKLSGMNFGILRYFNVAGADHMGRSGYSIENDPTHLIRRAVRVALGDSSHLEVYGTDYPTADGSAVRDYIHVSDLATAHTEVLAYLRKGYKSDVFNVGYGKGHSVLEVVNAVEKIIGKELPKQYKPRREGDSVAIVADNRKLLAATDWRPERQSLGGMILDELNWVKLQKTQ